MAQQHTVNVNFGGSVGSGGQVPTAAAVASAAPQVQQIQSPNLNIMSNHLREIAAGTSGFGKSMQSVGKSMGIKLGISGILKQSQLFTGLIGSLFQIAGAAVDIILAAFMPILVPVIRAIGGLLPRLSSMVETYLGRVVEWIVKFFEFISGDGLKDAVGGKVEGFFEHFLGEGSPLAERMGSLAGSIAGNGVQIALAAVAAGALVRFTRVGSGLALMFKGVTAVMNTTKIGRAVTTALGNSKVFQGISRFFSKGKVASDAAKAAKVAKAGSAASKGSRFGRFMGGALKMGKLSKAVPILGSVFMGLETAHNTFKNVKEAREAGKGWGTSLALGGTTLAAGLSTAALSAVAPGAGFVAYEGQQMAVNAMMNQFGGGPQRSLTQGTLTGTVVNVINNINGSTEENTQQQIKADAGSTTFTANYGQESVTGMG